MLCAGDEISRTQRGNNNAYCQDNKISWIDWELTPEQRDLREFVKKLIKTRSEQPVLRRRQFFQGRPIRGSGVKDVYWLEPSGKEMDDDGWNTGFVRSLGMLLPGNQIDETDERGQRIVGETLLLLLNAHHEPVSFTLPAHADGNWGLILDTSDPDCPSEEFPTGASYDLRDRSTAIFQFCPATSD